MDYVSQPTYIFCRGFLIDCHIDFLYVRSVKFMSEIGKKSTLEVPKYGAIPGIQTITSYFLLFDLETWLLMATLYTLD